MTCHFSSSIPWLGIMLCSCHLLYATEAAQQLTTTASSSSLWESFQSETPLAYNASSASKAALLSIFDKYGHNGALSFEGFEHFLESLGLGNITIPDHNISAHHEVRGSWSVELHDHHRHSPNNDPHHERHDKRHVSHVNDDKDAHQHRTSSALCVNCLKSRVKSHFSCTAVVIIQSANG